MKHRRLLLASGIEGFTVGCDLEWETSDNNKGWQRTVPSKETKLYFTFEKQRRRKVPEEDVILPWCNMWAWVLRRSILRQLCWSVSVNYQGKLLAWWEIQLWLCHSVRLSIVHSTYTHTAIHSIPSIQIAEQKKSFRRQFLNRNEARRRSWVLHCVASCLIRKVWFCLIVISNLPQVLYISSFFRTCCTTSSHSTACCVLDFKLIITHLYQFLIVPQAFAIRICCGPILIECVVCDDEIRFNATIVL